MFFYYTIIEMVPFATGEDKYIYHHRVAILKPPIGAVENKLTLQQQQESDAALERILLLLKKK